MSESGYSCECGRHYAFSAWVYAHWSITVSHICDCGVQALLKSGQVEKYVHLIPSVGPSYTTEGAGENE